MRLSQPLKKIPLGSLVRIKHYSDFEEQEDLYIVVGTEPMSSYELSEHREWHYTFCYVIVPAGDLNDFKKYHYHNELVVVSSS